MIRELLHKSEGVPTPSAISLTANKQELGVRGSLYIGIITCATISLSFIKTSAVIPTSIRHRRSISMQRRDKSNVKISRGAIIDPIHARVYEVTSTSILIIASNVKSMERSLHIPIGNTDACLSEDTPPDLV